jgi:radical SAM superfamily enzyme YgiQ (UPF0313 family)
LVVSQSGITKSAVRLIYPPLNLQQISALTPPGHHVAVIDEGFSKFDLTKNYEYDLIGISCNTRNAFRAYEISDHFRKQGKTVVLGGYHPSALPEEAKQHADSVVVGEADETWPQLIKDLENNDLKSFYFQNTPIEPENIIAPRREITKNFYFLSVLQASRGCPMGCDFCAITNQKFGKIFRKRPIEDVIEEIKSLKRKGFSFHDPSLTTDLNFTKSLFKEMAGLNKKFICYGNINMLGKDDELLQLASDAGCIGWSIGFDSLSQESLYSIQKVHNKVLEFTNSVKKIQDYNMTIFGSFIFGFDTDTTDVFRLTSDFLRRANIDVPIFNILTPYPGTPIYYRLEKEGRILTKDWSKYTLNNVVFQPKNMTKEELLNGTINMYKEFYSSPNTLKRIFKSLKLGFYSFLLVGIQNLPVWTATRTIEKRHKIYE